MPSCRPRVALVTFDIKDRIEKLRSWDIAHRRLMADEPDLAPEEVQLRPPSIEAIETEIARCRQLIDRISEELLETQAILDGAQALARTLGAMLDDARLEAAEQTDIQPARLVVP